MYSVELVRVLSTSDLEEQKYFCPPSHNTEDTLFRPRTLAWPHARKCYASQNGGGIRVGGKSDGKNESNLFMNLAVLIVRKDRNYANTARWNTR